MHTFSKLSEALLHVPHPRMLNDSFNASGNFHYGICTPIYHNSQYSDATVPTWYLLYHASVSASGGSLFGAMEYITGTGLCGSSSGCHGWD